MSQHWKSKKYLEKSSTSVGMLISFRIFLWLVFNLVLPSYLIFGLAWQHWVGSSMGHPRQHLELQCSEQLLQTPREAADEGHCALFRRRLSAKLLRLTLFWCGHSFLGNTLVNNFEVKMKNYSLSAFFTFIHCTFMTILVHLNGKAVLNANSLLLQAVSTVQLPVL